MNRLALVAAFGPMFGASAAWAQWGINGTSLFHTSGNVGVGLSNPAFPLHVRTGTSRALSAENTAASGLVYGVWGQTASTGGRAVSGWASAATGATSGLFGRSDSTSGRAVLGLATNATGTTYGVQGQSASTSGRGVFGRATSATGENYGVQGQCAGTTGAGVFGWATNQGVANNYGGFFQSDSLSGTGVHATGAYRGVVGEANGVAGIGVHGAGTSIGVRGYAASTSGVNYGVRGQTASSSSGAYGVHSVGNLGASGTKSFRIDHPDDPANKYLLHYSVESPEVLNAYSGTVTLDGAGAAAVELPHYFARINKDPRYTLTAVGAPMPLLHVAEEIDGGALIAGAAAAPGDGAPACSFRIAGGAPGMKVSWEVKAIRNDAWMRARGAPVEADKTGLERGTYQHPDLYGQPPQMGVNSSHRAGASDPARSEAAQRRPGSK